MVGNKSYSHCRLSCLCRAQNNNFGYKRILSVRWKSTLGGPNKIMLADEEIGCGTTDILERLEWRLIKSLEQFFPGIMPSLFLDIEVGVLAFRHNVLVNALINGLPQRIILGKT